MGADNGAPGPPGRYPAAWRGAKTSPLWVTPDDLIVVQVRNSLAAAKLQLNARLWHPDEGVMEFNLSMAPTSARALNTFTQQLYYGYLVSAAVTAQSPFPTRGQTLASLSIARPPATAPITKLYMAQDYLTSQNAVLWPEGRAIAGVEGPGVLLSTAVANPAAATDWTLTVPANARWRVRGGSATLVTGVVAPVRQVALVIDDGANTFYTIEAATTQAASLTQIYNLLPGDTLTTLISTQLPVFLPTDLVLFAGWRIRTSTTAIAGLDQWSAIRLLIEENLED